MIFADTSALLAALIDDDRSHQAARRAEAALRSAREELWTIDPVLTELWQLLRRRLGQDRADALLAGLLDRGIRREPLADGDYVRAREIGREWPHGGLSLTDRQAFAVMERTRRYRAWSYDSDFSMVKLGPGRPRAIQLVR